MKKLFALILFSVFLINLAAIPVVFHITRFMIREDMEQKIRENPEESELTMLTLSAQEFSCLHWTRVLKEFEYKGNMYDVVRIKSVQHKKLIYCLSDNREKHLLAQYRTHQKTRKNNHQRTSKTELSKYFPAEQHYSFPSGGTDLIYFHARSRIVLNRLSPPSPPPKPIISC
ncbi:MAG: hypothetical protein JXR71_02025 [Bacteroidales bacterium]|nr:hypothetical protein [Bacteroidales bacterium]